MRSITESGFTILTCCNQDCISPMEECTCGPGMGCRTPEDAFKRQRIRHEKAVKETKEFLTSMYGG